VGLASSWRPERRLERRERNVVSVSVSVPCMGERPSEAVALREMVSRAEWDAMPTDRREALKAGQSLGRKVCADKLTAASAGCR